ncbi:MAG: EamA family transporter [Acidobacteria bacterium]|nr:EamA family transporter [Acidobacteriota bacterium]
MAINALSGTLKSRWFWYSILTVVGWAGWALFLKIGSAEIPTGPSLFLQTTGMIPLAVIMVLARTVRRSESKIGLGYSLLNGIITGIGILCLVAAYRSGGNVSVVAVMSALYPIVTFALAVPILHEKLTKVQMLGLLLATASIVIFSL